jgi:hypothetical protein
MNRPAALNDNPGACRGCRSVDESIACSGLGVTLGLLLAALLTFLQVAARRDFLDHLVGFLLSASCCMPAPLAAGSGLVSEVPMVLSLLVRLRQS